MQKTVLSFCLLLLSIGSVAQVTTRVFSLGTHVLFLEIGEKTSMTYTWETDSGDAPAIVWQTSDEHIATINSDGLVTAMGEGTCTITASYDNNQQSRCMVVVGNTAGYSDGYSYVNLGLPSGTLWATTNIGADSPEESGSHYQWRGEGSTDDDAAFTDRGAYWRTQSLTQFEELVDVNNTSAEPVSMNGIDGLLIKSLTNGKCLFLPVGQYWSRTRSDNANMAYDLDVSNTMMTSNHVSDIETPLGIRPVFEVSSLSSAISVSTTHLDFGTVATGSARTMTIDVRNNTFTPQDILPFGMVESDFSIDWTGGTILSNATQQVKVTYSPTTAGSVTGGNLRIGTLTDSVLVNVTASSHNNSANLTSKKDLVVWFKDGSKQSYLLNDHPVVTVKEGKVKIEAENIGAEYDFSLILKLTYEGPFSDVPMIASDSDKAMTLTSDALSFFAASEDLNIQIVSAAGVVLRQFTVPQGAARAVPLNQFHSGVYIINVNQNSHKISIR